MTNRIAELEKLGSSLEPEGKERNELASQALSYAGNFVDSLDQQPGYRTGSLNKLKALSIDDAGKPLDALLEILHDEVDALGINSASGRHLGYIPGGGLWTSALADMLAAASNRYAGIAYSSPGSVEIENQMIRWLTSIVGYPNSAHGNLTSGGSIANLIAVKAARDAHGINSKNVDTAVIYFSGHAHHCIQKAFSITGLHEAILRPIPLNDRFEMNVEILREQIENDVRAGLHPFLVVATAGTTDTGAIDPLDDIGSICAQHKLWFHVDAAYGGFFILLNEMKEKFKGIEKSDSLVMDPHKTLFIPYGSGIVLVKNKEDLFDSNAHQAAYMKDAYSLEEINPADTGPELSRHARGLRMWLPLHIHGLAPFKANLEEKLLLCRYFYDAIKSAGFETGPSPDLSVTIFRLPGDTDNHLNEKLVQALHDDGRVFFSSTSIDGKLWVRCAVVHFRTHMKEIDLALRMIDEIAGKLKNVFHKP